MKFTGKITDANVDFRSGQPKITLAINERNDFLQGYDDLKDIEKLSIEIKPYRKRRSLDANAYAWVLIDKLAENQGVTKEEIYRECVKNIGGNSEVVCVKDEAVDKLCRGWSHKGIGWQTDTFPSKLAGCTNVILYYGSSLYDTKQMSLLIDNLIQDCKAVGIQTETPDQIAEMKARWGES